MLKQQIQLCLSLQIYTLNMCHEPSLEVDLCLTNYNFEMFGLVLLGIYFFTISHLVLLKIGSVFSLRHKFIVCCPPEVNHLFKYSHL